MNILLFTDADVFAGTERHILDLAVSLRELGQFPTIACPEPGALAARARGAQIPLLPIPKRGLLDKAAIRQLTTRLAHNEFDILHAHNGRTHLLAALAIKHARRSRAICIATQHFLSPTRTTRHGPKAFLANLLHKHASRFTAHTIAISEAVRAAALARRDCPPNRITTIHNGIHPPELPPNHHRAAVRASLGIAPETPLILCAARLQKEKDIPTLLRAMNRLTAAHPHAKCLLAGEGDELPALQSLTHSLLLNQSIRFLGFRNDIPSLIDACDLFVLPSLAEPFGLVLLEAMALAKPVIATNAGGPPEIIDNHRTGLLVPPSDPAALAAALEHLLENPEKRRAFAAAAHARYLTHFTAKKMAAQTLALYQKCSRPIPDEFPLNPAPANAILES